jgi:hypothetical protein
MGAKTRSQAPPTIWPGPHRGRNTVPPPTVGASNIVGNGRWAEHRDCGAFMIATGPPKAGPMCGLCLHRREEPCGVVVVNRPAQFTIRAHVHHKRRVVAASAGQLGSQEQRHEPVLFRVRASALGGFLLLVLL